MQCNSPQSNTLFTFSSKKACMCVCVSCSCSPTCADFVEMFSIVLLLLFNVKRAKRKLTKKSCRKHNACQTIYIAAATAEQCMLNRCQRYIFSSTTPHARHVCLCCCSCCCCSYICTYTCIHINIIYLMFFFMLNLSNMLHT